MGGDKRAYIAALRQAKFYLPREAAAAAAAVHEILFYPLCTVAGVLQQLYIAAAMNLKVGRRSTRAAVHKILFYPSCTAAAPQ